MTAHHSSMSYSHGYCNTPAAAASSMSFFARVDTVILAVSILLYVVLCILVPGNWYAV